MKVLAGTVRCSFVLGFVVFVTCDALMGEVDFGMVERGWLSTSCSRPYQTTKAEDFAGGNSG